MNKSDTQYSFKGANIRTFNKKQVNNLKALNTNFLPKLLLGCLLFY